MPLWAFEWFWEWVAYILSNWSFLEVLEYLGSFSILIAVIFYFSESGDRLKQKHYQAWQVINTAQGKGGSGGRVEALQELNADGVPLVGVDVSGAFLQSIHLQGARLLRSNFSGADLRDSDLAFADLSDADLRSANIRQSNLHSAHFQHASLDDAAYGAPTSATPISPARRSSTPTCGLRIWPMFTGAISAPSRTLIFTVSKTRRMDSSPGRSSMAPCRSNPIPSGSPRPETRMA